MKNKIFLKYDGDISRFEWALLSSDNRLIESGEALSIEELKKRVDFDHSETHLLIGTPDVVMKEIKIPQTIPPHKINMVLPSFLEDEILSPLEDLHSVFKLIEKGKILVLSIRKSLMIQLIEPLHDENVYPLTIRPLYLAFKTSSDKSIVFNDLKYAFLQIDPLRGFCIDRDQFSEFLPFCELQIKDKTLHIFGKLIEEDKLKITSQIEKINFEGEIEWPKLLEANQTDFNLLVEPFTQAKQNNKNKDLRKHAVITAILVPVLLLSFFAYEYYQLSNINGGLVSQITKIYKTLYPNAQSVTSPRQRIEQELKSISSESKGDFFQFLYYVGEYTKNITNLDLVSLSYRDHELNVTLEADNYQTIDKLMKALNDKNYKVEQKNTSTQQDKVHSVLIVKWKK